MKSESKPNLINLVFRFDKGEIGEYPYEEKESECICAGYVNGYAKPITSVEAFCDDVGREQAYRFQIEESVSAKGSRIFLGRLLPECEKQLGKSVSLLITEIPKGTRYSYGFHSIVDGKEDDGPSKRSLSLFDD